MYNKLDLVGMEVQAADGGNYGHRILAYKAEAKDYIVQPIRWSTGDIIGPVSRIDDFKITYRYQTDNPRKAVSGV